MSYEINLNILQKYKEKTVYLFDSGVFVRSEEISSFCGVDFVEVFSCLPNEHFFLTNEVLVEIANGPRQLDWKFFKEHLLNAEGGMDPSWKENRFLIENEGKLHYIVLNKVSSVDYAQVLLCQNHTDLTLVSNDRKLLKSAAHIIPGRILGFPVLIERLSKKYSSNKDIEIINKAIGNLYSLKNPFGDNH